jgi:hypothetical protein
MRGGIIGMGAAVLGAAAALGSGLGDPKMQLPFIDDHRKGKGQRSPMKGTSAKLWRSVRKGGMSGVHVANHAPKKRECARRIRQGLDITLGTAMLTQVKVVADYQYPDGTETLGDILNRALTKSDNQKTAG